MSDVQRVIAYGERGSVHLVADAAALAREAAEIFISTANDAVAARGVALIALSGGSTPKQMGALLAKPEYQARVPWDKIQIFWSDERWTPIESADSNAGEAKRGFLDLVPIPAENVHPYLTTGVTPAESAAAYESLIRSIAGQSEAIPVFDLIFLGMGDDGHTASLFPQTAAVHETTLLVAPNDVPKLNTTRLTFTAPLLNAARRVVFLAAGAGKASRLAEVLDGLIDIDALPSQIVRPAGGPEWLVDVAAVANLARVTGE